MATRRNNFLAFIDFFSEIARRFGWSPQAADSNSRNEIDRIWTPYGTHGRVYGMLPRDPTQSVVVECGRAYSLQLDREWTVPGAKIGVKVGSPPSSRSDFTVLQPGDTITAPNGFLRVYIHAADNADLYLPDLTNVCGYVSFLISRSILGRFPVSKEPHPLARVIAATGVQGQPVRFLPVTRSVRVTATPVSALGVPLDCPLSAALKVEFNQRLILTAAETALENSDYTPAISLAPSARRYVLSNIHAIDVDGDRQASQLVEAGGLFTTLTIEDIAVSFGTQSPDALNLLVEAVTQAESRTSDDTVVLLSEDGADNVELTTQAVATDDVKEISVHVIYTGAATGAVVGLLQEGDEGGVYRTFETWNIAAAWYSSYSPVETHLPRLRVIVPAGGAGCTAHVRIIAKKVRS
jgi:hypothetical protein